ncbi:hypothetical protein WUBG_12352, partial [Wuchereria bancrofti]
MTHYSLISSRRNRHLWYHSSSLDGYGQTARQKLVEINGVENEKASHLSSFWKYKERFLSSTKIIHWFWSKI